MFETYRMLGREREAELLREAERLHHLARRRPRRSLANVVLAARAAIAITFDKELIGLGQHERASANQSANH